MGRRGGSLEKGIASLEDLQTEVEAGGLVNLYWIGRVNDATVRHDRDVLAYLDEAPNVWLTTWGEAWSSWSGKRCYEYQRDVVEVEGKTVITFESKETEVCRSVFDELPWNVPLTWLIDVEGASVTDVSSHGTSLRLPSIEGEKVAKEGWWQQADGTLVLSVLNGHAVNITVNATGIEHDILAQTEFFNNHSAAVTVAGHETTDLFKWAKRFVDDTDVRFTWLVQPRPAEAADAWIPYAVVGVSVLTVFIMLGVLGREGLGPGQVWRTEKGGKKAFSDGEKQAKPMLTGEAGGFGRKNMAKTTSSLFPQSTDYDRIIDLFRFYADGGCPFPRPNPIGAVFGPSRARPPKENPRKTPSLSSPGGILGQMKFWSFHGGKGQGVSQAAGGRGHRRAALFKSQGTGCFRKGPTPQELFRILCSLGPRWDPRI
ncbi:MAG: hypothetical protein CM15mP78_08160 [Candidatus Poseidoniales archaeon]|nr:MAG: hypothetical protein CM15mP78_08160 [Candidatus Poseidoniales archaeon]